MLIANFTRLRSHNETNDVTQWNHEKLKSESGGYYSVVGKVQQK